MGLASLQGRRAITLAALTLSLPPPSNDLSVAQAVAIIRAQCDPTFLRAVRTTGALLYRGESLGQSAAQLLSPAPDLLDVATYGSADALRYFETLESALGQAVARPSTGHIGVANAEAASQWGAAASIWPLGKPLHYVWPRDRSEFWPAPSTATQDGGLATDIGLEDALRHGREILFCAESGAAYVALDARLDDEVRRRLDLSPRR